MKKYNVADYAFQFITVTAGVLIALFIDGLSDWNSNRQLVAEAKATIAREVADNLTELSGLSKSVAATNAEIDNAQRLADDLLSKGKTDVHTLSLNFHLATLNSSGWMSADRTGAVGNMPYEEVKKYSELYGLQALFDTQQRKAIDLVAASTALMVGNVDPTKAGKEDLTRLRQELMLLRANLYVTDQLGQQLLEAYRKFQSGK